MGTDAPRMLRQLVTGSLLLSALLASVLAVRQSGWALVALAISLLILALRLAIPRIERRGWPTRWLLAAAALNLMLVVPELALRVAGFRFESGIEYGFPRPRHFVEFEPDERLLWKLRPADGVNSFGLPGEEIVVPKPDGVYRIVFIGDSVTQQGFPQIVRHLLDRTGPPEGETSESVTLALAGYSSHQGRILADLYGSMLEPDRVVVLYGWNDHWLAYGAPDAEKIVAVDDGWPARAWRSLNRESRLVQAARAVGATLTGHAGGPTSELRVPEERYRANLREIARGFRERSIPVLFVTAPSSHPRLGVPDYLVDQGFATDAGSVLALHRRYNEITRQAAREAGSELLDLDAEFRNRSDDFIEAAFLSDGIHLTAVGLAVVAERISEAIDSGATTFATPEP